MRLDEKIAVRLAYRHHRLSSNGPVEINEEDYWELILTDSVRATYLALAREAVYMIRKDDAGE
jgi:hypothetical protein